jgi:hypothetical protein
MLPIGGDCVPVVLLPVVPDPLIPGLSLVDPAAPDPIPLELLPDCCASTRGAAVKTMARVDMIVLLSLLVIDIFSSFHYMLLHLLVSTRQLHCLTLC